MQVTVKHHGLTIMGCDLWTIILMMVFTREFPYEGRIKDLKVFVDDKEIPMPAEMSDDS